MFNVYHCVILFRDKNLKRGFGIRMDGNSFRREFLEVFVKVTVIYYFATGNADRLEGVNVWIIGMFELFPLLRTLKILCLA